MESVDILPQSANSESTKESIESLEGSFDRLRGGFAYVTQPGLRRLRSALPECFDGNTQQEWLVSISSGITDPATLRALSEQPNTTVRVVAGVEALESTRFEPASLFHPKLLWVTDGDNHSAIIGSANLTQRAFESNWELGIALKGMEPPADRPILTNLDIWWGRAWGASVECGGEFLEQYELLWEEYVDENPSEYVKRAASESSLAEATYLWADVETSMGYNDHQIELPTQCLQYFLGEAQAITEGDEIPVTFRFNGQDYSGRNIRAHPNDMCRINLPNDLGRQYDVTEYSIVFERLGTSRFKIDLVSPDEYGQIIGPLRERSITLEQVLEMPGRDRECGWL